MDGKLRTPFIKVNGCTTNLSFTLTTKDEIQVWIHTNINVNLVACYLLG